METDLIMLHNVNQRQEKYSHKVVREYTSEIYMIGNSIPAYWGEDVDTVRELGLHSYTLMQEYILISYIGHKF